MWTQCGRSRGGVVSISIPQLDADHRKDAVAGRKRGDFTVLTPYPIINSSANQTTYIIPVSFHFIISSLRYCNNSWLPCSHRVAPNPRRAAVRGALSLSCCSACLWFTCSTPPGCFTASSTPNPATEAEESTASPPTWQQDPDYRLAQAFVSYFLNLMANGRQISHTIKLHFCVTHCKTTAQPRSFS